jgi:hypothetical protein
MLTTRPPVKLEPIPFGAFCNHRRMRFVRCMKYDSYVRCDICEDKTRRPCTVECPECGLNYCFFNG